MGDRGREGAFRWAMLRRGVVAVAALVVVAAACAPAPGGGGAPTTTDVPVPPTITGFGAIRFRTEAPVAAVLGWTVGDANGDPLVCRIDTDGDGTVDRVVDPCPGRGSVLVDYSGPGVRLPTLEVDDGVSGATTASTEVTVAPGPSESFEITLRFAPTMPAQFRDAFQAAADRWAEVIRAGVPDVGLTVIEGFGGWMPAFDGVVDDLLIMARDIEMDGPRGTLGHAGALLVRDTGHPYLGVMEFDTADLQRFADTGRLEDLILHEMGHVLGLGANWALEGRLDDLLTDPSYNGPVGVAAWHELGGTGQVPVEATGGFGTALAHWRESTFDDELMTGYSDVGEALSRVTIGALADRGYGVDLGAADPYVLPAPSATFRTDGLLEEHQHTEPLTPLPGNHLPGG